MTTTTPPTVTEFESELQRAWERKVDEFCAIHAKYLRARADGATEDDDITRKAADAETDALWQLIRTRAPLAGYVGYKIEIFRGLIEENWIDGRTRALFESILLDCEKLGKWDFSS
jgi:hypothetical protein